MESEAADETVEAVELTSLEAEQKAEIADLLAEAKSATDEEEPTELPLWLDVFAEQLSRSAPDKSSTALAEIAGEDTIAGAFLAQLNTYSIFPLVIAIVGLTTGNMEVPISFDILEKTFNS